MPQIVNGNQLVQQQLSLGWEFVETAAGQIQEPAQLTANALAWLPLTSLTTVAAGLREFGLFEFGERNFDDFDYWFRCVCDFPKADFSTLSFDGLATLADVYWNNELLFSSDNMFHQHQWDCSGCVGKGVLYLHFKALTPALNARRPRARWRTRLVAQQQLRWQRTTLLGRIPGWSPPVAPVGAYRPITLRQSNKLNLELHTLRTQLRNADGVVEFDFSVRCLNSDGLRSAQLQVGADVFELTPDVASAGRIRFSGQLQLASPQLWWPHTHGKSNLYQPMIKLGYENGLFEFTLPRIGFRSIEVNQQNGDFALSVNGVSIFCRGACWTPLDIVSLSGTEDDYRQALMLARDAGMNMLRVGGTMVYEQDSFYRLCDELGIMIWHDCMFANMDYPVADPVFLSSIKKEVQQFLLRVQASPAMAVLCGNSEIEQQAAMLGLPSEMWTNSFFADDLPALCLQLCPDLMYWPSSPSGGVLPFQIDAGVSHYYGVGAYLRPLEDARRAEVRFTTECLGFSNVPDDVTIEAFLGNGEVPFHHPRWKQRVPRDSGAGWDFEDVRDHYMEQLFGLDPMCLRYADIPRYLELARVTTGEIMAGTFAEWRRTGSTCGGGLVWFLRDLWPGAGWGLIDARGRPKAAYYFVRRAMQSRTVFITDEGLNGLMLHVVNDDSTTLCADLELKLLRHGDTTVAQAKNSVTVPPHSQIRVRANAMFEHFLDTSFAYKFGPASHELAAASLYVDNQVMAQAVHFPLGRDANRNGDSSLEAICSVLPDGGLTLAISTQSFAQSVAIDVPGYLPEDNFFHVFPGVGRTILLRSIYAVTKLSGTVTPLNSRYASKIKFSEL